MLTPFAAVFVAAACVADGATFGQLAENLSRMRKEFRTVEIEFTLERRDAVFQKPRMFTGKFVALRADGEFYAMLQFRPDDMLAEAESFVLRGDELTLWDARTKTATPIPSAKAKGGFRYAADHFSGLVWLLDRDAAGKRLKATAFKRDPHYTYFDVEVDEYSVLNLFGDPKPYTVRYRIAAAQSADVNFPKHTIRQIYVTQPSGDTANYKITKWAVDAADHAKMTADKIPDPAKPPEGWTMRP